MKKSGFESESEREKRRLLEVLLPLSSQVLDSKRDTVYNTRVIISFSFLFSSLDSLHPPTSKARERKRETYLWIPQFSRSDQMSDGKNQSEQDTSPSYCDVSDSEEWVLAAYERDGREYEGFRSVEWCYWIIFFYTQAKGRGVSKSFDMRE